MKILYIITQSSWGGAQKYVYTFASNLANKGGLNIMVAGGEESIGELATRLLDKNIEFYPLKKLVRRIHIFNDLMAVWEIKKLIDRWQPDIVHLNSSKAGAVGSLAAKFSNYHPRVIYTVHGWVFNEKINPIIRLMYFLIEKIFSNYKDYFICLSDLDRKVGLKFKIAPANKLVTIHNGLNLTDDYFLSQKLARESLNIDDSVNEILVGTIANFYSTKGLQYLITATNILVNDHQLPIKTVIIGEGNLRLELEKQLKDLHLENHVILAGSIKGAGKYLKAFDIAVMSSVKEGLPYFLLEAMSAGLPIVATSVGGIPEMIIDGQNGFLVDSKNPKQLADKIKILIDNKELAASMANKNLVTAKEKFSLETMVNKTLTIYK